MLRNDRCSSTPAIFLYAIFFLFTMGTLKVYAKVSIEDKMENHVRVLNKLIEKKDSVGLVVRMLIIQKDVDDYKGHSYDYKCNSIYFYIDKIFEEFLKNPNVKISKKDINDYKKFVSQIKNKLPCDFFINKDDDSQSYYNYGITPSIENGITISLCGLFLSFIPIPICQKIGPSLLTFGAHITFNGLMEKADEDYKRKKEMERRKRRREREGHWDTEDNTQWVHPRNERPWPNR